MSGEIVTIGQATLYHGDCREILPALPKVDLVLTDMPYGTGWVLGGGNVAGEFNARHEKPEWDVFSVEWMQLVPKGVLIAAFCAKSYLADLVSAFDQPHVWRYKKTNVRPNGCPYEFIVANFPALASKWEVVAYNGDNDFHPTQKPLRVMEWCLNLAPKNTSTVADPFMGSGTTGVACANLGKTFIGIELDRKYFDIACERITCAYAQERLFV